MTIHSAKGLEFPVVMVTGLEEGLFPLGPHSYEVEELEEERRLFYVALTRAEKKAYLSFAHARRRFGGAPIPTTQSRFLHELPEELLEHILPAQRTDRQGYSSPVSKPIVPSAPSNELSIGHQVEHKLFGKGKILAVENN